MLQLLSHDWTITVWGRDLANRRLQSKGTEQKLVVQKATGSKQLQHRPSACFQADIKQQNHNLKRKAKPNQKTNNKMIGKKESIIAKNISTKAKRNQIRAGLPRCGHAGGIKKRSKALRGLQEGGSW